MQFRLIKSWLSAVSRAACRPANQGWVALLGLGAAFFLSVYVSVAAGRAAQGPAARRQQNVIDRSRTQKYRPDRVLVRFRPGVSRQTMQAAHDALGTRVLTELAIVDRLQLVQIASGSTVEDAVRNF